MTTVTQQATVIRIGRLSKSAFLSEAASPAPRLERMVAHGCIFDKTLRYTLDGLDLRDNNVQHTTGSWSSEQSRSKAWRQVQPMVVQVQVTEVEIEDND